MMFNLHTSQHTVLFPVSIPISLANSTVDLLFHPLILTLPF